MKYAIGLILTFFCLSALAQDPNGKKALYWSDPYIGNTFLVSTDSISALTAIGSVTTNVNNTRYVKTNEWFRTTNGDVALPIQQTRIVSDGGLIFSGGSNTMTAGQLDVDALNAVTALMINGVDVAGLFLGRNEFSVYTNIVALNYGRFTNLWVNNTAFIATTNLVTGVYGAGSDIANRTYFGTVNFQTNYDGGSLSNNGGAFIVRAPDNTILYTYPSLNSTNGTLVGGMFPVPSISSGFNLNVDGARIIGNIVESSTNLQQNFSARPTFLQMTNAIISIFSQDTNNPFSGVWVDVQKFGAVPDNTTPADVAFRMAYTNAMALNEPIFIQGQYLLTNNFVITNRGMTFFSFGNPNDFATGPNGLPDICIHFGPSATNGFIFTELSQAQQSDSGEFANISVFMENTNGAGFVFSSTNGTSDGMIFNNVAVKSGLIPYAGGLGINAQNGLSRAYFNNITFENTRVGFLITNAPTGINQGGYFLLNGDSVGTEMELHSFQGGQVTFNHISGLTRLLAMEGANEVRFFCGHIEWRGLGQAVIQSVGAGGNNVEFSGAVEDFDNSWLLECVDSGAQADNFVFDNFLYGGHTNISGGVCYIKLNHPDNDVQHLIINGQGTRAALYSGVTLLSSNAPASFGVTWNPVLTSWPNLPKGNLQWDFSTLPAKLYVDRQTNQAALNYERLFLNQYDDDFRNGVIALIAISNNFAGNNTFNQPNFFLAPQSFKAGAFANTIQTTTTNLGGDGHYTAGVEQQFRVWGGTQDAGSVGGAAQANASTFGGVMWLAPNANATDHTPMRDVLQAWWDRTVHVGGLLIVSNSVATSGGKPNAVTVGASPFVFVNTTGVNLECYFSSTAVAYSISKNGAAVYPSLVGDDYLILQPTNSLTVTFSVTPPTLFTNAW